MDNKPRRRRLLLCLAIGVPLLAIVVIVAIVWAWPSVLRGTLERELGASLGGDVTVGDIAWDDGALRLDDVYLRAPGLEGKAAEVLAIDRMRVQVSVGAAFTSASMVQSIHIEHATLVVAGETDVSKSKLNISSLRIGGNGGVSVSSGSTPPSIIVDRLNLVVGLFSGSTFTQTGSAVFQGRLDGHPDGQLHGDLEQLDVETPLVLTATGNPSTASGHIAARGLLLNPTTRGLLPFPAVQSALSTLDLDGAVPTFEVAFKNANPVHALLVLDDLSLRLDPDWFALRNDKGFWVSFRNGSIERAAEAPIMRVEGGRIEFEDDQLTVSTLRGVLEGPNGESVAVPWSVDLDIEALMETLAEAPNMKAALDKVPFMLRLSADRFRLEQGEPVVLPRRTARILELFGVQSGTAGIHLQASHAGAGASVQVSGVVTIEDARGAYEQFPYPLTGLNAQIDFDLDKVYVRNLSADGRQGSTLEIDGVVDAADGEGIDLSIRARHVPIDGVFMSAMPEVAASALRDVLPPERSLPLLSGAFSARAVQRPFGDEVDLDLHIGREPGGTVAISGQIRFERLELQWQAFPWPVLLDRGYFDWRDGGLTLRSESGDGVSLRTPDGIVGHIEVAMQLPPLESDADASIFNADVELHVHGQPITGALREAVGELSQEGGTLLRDTNLTGVLDLDAHVHLTTTVPSTFTVEVGIRNGLGDTSGLPVAEGVTLADLLHANDCQVNGTIVVERSNVTLRSFHIVSGEGSLELSGDVPGDGQTSIKGTSLFAGAWVAELMGENDRPKARQIAHRWHPFGTFDLEGMLHAKHGLHGNVTQAKVELRGMHPPVQLTQSSGALALAGDAVGFEAMGIDIDMGDRMLGRLSLEGRTTAGATDIRIEGFGLDLGTPMAKDLIFAVAGDRIGQVWAELDPAGIADIDATVGIDAWRLDVRPASFAVTRGGSRVAVVVDSGVLDIHDTGLTIDNLSVHTASGTRARFDGSAEWSDASLRGRFEIDGQLSGPLVTALGGIEVAGTLREIGFDDGLGSRLSQGRLHLEHLDEAPTGTIEADIALQDARFALGVELDAVQSRMQLGVELLGKQRAKLQLHLLDAAGAVGPLPFHGVMGVVRSGDEGVIVLRDIAGTLAEGRFVVDGQVDQALATWEANVVLAGARLEAMAPGDSDADGDRIASGRVDSSMRLHGSFSSPASRFGVGQFRISNGDLGPLPLAVGLQQLLHLSSPLVNAIDYADVQFHIDGERAVLDDIVLEASSGDIAAFSLLGAGTFDWKTLDVDLRLRPRGGWLVISDIIGFMQDQLYEISVTGSLLDPDVGLVGLPGLTDR